MSYFGSCEVLQTDGCKELMGEFGQRVSCYGQRHRVSRPYRKNEQAFVESFHRTLRKECLGWWTYKPSEGEELQNEAQQYLDFYHYEWPHLGLGLQPPLLPPFRI
jgi:transposase InsO family protein